jgi:transposase
MPQTKEISEDLRLRIVDLHKAGKGYKIISKSLDVYQSTVRKIVNKWRKISPVATLPGRNRPVDESTICKTLKQEWCSREEFTAVH